MKQTYAPTDRLYEAAKELQKNDPNLPFSEALKIAAKAEDARRSTEHGKNSSHDDEPEDWQAELDRRYDAAKAYQEANPDVSFEQAMIEAAKQADQENTTAFSQLHVMGREQGKPATASESGKVPYGALPGTPVLRCIGFKDGKLQYATFPS